MNAFWKRPLAALLLILAVGVAAYSNTFDAPFTFDDRWSLVNEPANLSLENFFASSGPYESFPHRFIGILSFALNHHFGGLDVTGYHLVNLLIHLMSAVLVYLLLRQTLRTPYFQSRAEGPKTLGEGKASLAFIPIFAALLFVAHPVQTQAVTYIIQRFTSLTAMFYLLSVVLYVQARLVIESQRPSLKAPIPSGRETGSVVAGSGRFVVGLLLAASVAAALLAMKTKEIAVTLPLAVVLYEACFFLGHWKKRLACLLPLLVTLPVIPVSVFLAGQPFGDPGEEIGAAGGILSAIDEKSRAFTSMSRLDYLFTQFRVIVTYLRLLVLPVNQNLDYDYPVYKTFFTPPVFFSFLLLTALFALAVYFWFVSRRQPSALRLVSFGILWFFLTLALESSIIPIPDVIFEHRLYLPAFGAAAAFAGFFFLLFEKLFREGGSKWLIAVSILVVAGLAVATFQRNHVWGDEISLWEDVVDKSPRKGRPLNNLGVALELAGRRADAARVFARAIEVEPSYFKSYYNLADLYLVSDQPERSLPLLQVAIRIKPDFTEAYVKMGAALLRGGQFQETVTFLERYLDRVGDQAEARFYLGAAYAFLGQREAARRELEIVSQLDARFASQLAGLLERKSSHGSPHGRN